MSVCDAVCVPRTLLVLQASRPTLKLIEQLFERCMTFEITGSSGKNP